MMVMLGIVVGGILGAVALGFAGAFVGAFAGFIVMMVWRSRTQARERAAGHPGAGVPVFPERARQGTAPARPRDATALPQDAIVSRLDALEARLAALERRMAPGAVAAVAAEVDAVRAAALASAPDRTSVLPDPERTGIAPAPDGIGAMPDGDVSPRTTPDTPPGFRRTPEGTLEPVASAVAPMPSAGAAAGTTGEHVEELMGQASGALPSPPEPSIPPAPHPVWAWFTGGNLLTRVGVIALFVGVGFLLKELVQVVTVPIGVRLAGVALAGALLMGLGARLVRTRPGYGVSLEGAGAGILYLTTFAALRLYDVLPPGPAFGVLLAVSALTVWLAARADSQPLAGLAIAGGFLAPFLVSTSAGSPALLLGYFLVLNVAILALALVKSWRALNVLGFVFTFVLGAFWGHRFYRPEHFATVEPFLVTFFVFYLAIAILHARRAPFEARRPVDGILVFGVPLVGFALQAALLRDTRYGVAISGFVLAALYGALAAFLRARPEPGFPLLARAFVALAVIFLTVAIPFAVDPEWTAAWWALEAAGVYWIGCAQRQPLARGFSLLLQVGAALAFALAGWDASGTIFANAVFLGAILIAIAAIATVGVGDAHADVLHPFERSLAPVLFAWGAAWWLAAGAIEIERVVAEAVEAHAMLAYALGGVVLALAVSRVLAWPRLAWLGAVLLPVMMAVAFVDWQRAHSTLGEHGWVLWPAVWVLQWVVLRAIERPVHAGSEASFVAHGRYLGAAHAASAIALVAWIAWEASEWVGRSAAPGSVWLPCAAVWPAVFYLVAMAYLPPAARWPFGRFRDAYVRTAATVIATLACVWFLLVNVFSPGGAPPLPYIPLANPLDLTLLAVLAAVFAWCSRATDVDERTLFTWQGVALFILVNAIVFRTVHQWGGVPWRFNALSASKVLQAALTLTWTVTALPLMVVAHRHAIRPLWMVGAALLALVVGKLFLLDLASLSGLPRIVAFIGVGALLLVIGYLAPLPPAKKAAQEG